MTSTHSGNRQPHQPENASDKKRDNSGPLSNRQGVRSLNPDKPADRLPKGVAEDKARVKRKKDGK